MVRSFQVSGDCVQTAIQREDAYKHFRFTRRTTLISLTGFVFVPGAIYYLASQTQVRTAVFVYISWLTMHGM